MAHRLEIALVPELTDAPGETLRRKARKYFGIAVENVRTVDVLTIDADLSADERRAVQREIFCNPVTQISSWQPLALAFDWLVWVGLRPGVRDNAGATAQEAIEDLLGRHLAPGEAVYTSHRYCLQGPGLTRAAADTIAAELLANDIIQQWRVIGVDQWDPQSGVGLNIPKVRLDHRPTVTTVPVDSDRRLARVSRERNLALNPADIPVIRAYFNDAAVRRARRAVGLDAPTDVEIEYISQARSDHCNHNTFQGRFHYREAPDAPVETVDNLFATFIRQPTLELQRRCPWVVSVLWDNAGVARFDAEHNYVITGETHNSPSTMEAYGGAITGIVGVYRDPLGTGKGARLIMGAYGFCVGPREYAGPLRPRLHPRRLLDGIVEGVRDGGNKSGIPTPFGQVTFDTGYLGKCLVFVTALGLMPARIQGAPSHEKTTRPGDLIVMCGGRVGKDGIHGVTASSESYSAHTPAGHVQIGDPYTQKKMHDFLLEARDAGLIAFITDNGGGGLSSSVGESARFSGGCRVELEKVPLKYDGLDQWEIWVSESQERMTVAVHPDHLDAFLGLADTHAVEATVIGCYTGSGKLHITYDGATCAYVDLDLLTAGFPQWEFNAVWRSPRLRGLHEPVLGAAPALEGLLPDLLARPNICSKEWISRQYDHEVQGTSVIKPLVGARRDVPSDAAVLRPVLTSARGLAYAQALLPAYARIDAYHMTACTIDEAVRRVVAVGGDPDQIGGVDNFCWPGIGHDPAANPDGDFKAAQLVRACRALRDLCQAWSIPLLSGKDSMYVDGHLPDGYGLTHKVSGLPTMQFAATAPVTDVAGCTTMDCKRSGDGVYLLGETRDELGASEYYVHLGYVGCNVPQVWPQQFKVAYRALAGAIRDGLAASVHGVYRGGLGIHLALVALGGDLGLTVDLAAAPGTSGLRDDTLLFAESAGRFIVTVAPDRQEAFDRRMRGLPWARIGTVTADDRLIIRRGSGDPLGAVALDRLRSAWQAPFGDLL